MNYRNAQRLSNGWIDCEIEHPAYGWIPFTCNPKDLGAEFDVAALYKKMNSDPKTAAYVPPTQEELDAVASRETRVERKIILATVVDPLVSNPLRWADLTVEQQQAWADYRRALLDVPQQSGFPSDVIWPTQPK